ncbi:MAG: hypothetical protein P0121_16010 [Nitrospira sp.]|nr:hypothetical protein [Nitrospira sp.]
MTTLRFVIMVMLTVTTLATAPELSEACLSSQEGHADLHPSSTLLESASPGRIVLRPEGVRSVLHPPQNLAQVAPGEVLRRVGASQRLLLLLCDLRAAQTPETLFHVYLNLPEQADQATRANHLLAQFNFFAALRPGDQMTPVWQSVDVTQAVGALAEQGMIETEATLTILAARPFDPKSRPSLGRIAIVQQ